MERKFLSLVKNNNLYDIKLTIRDNLIYRLLIISSIIGYWIHVPKYNNIYLFHLMILFYFINEIKDHMFNGRKIKINEYSLKYLVFFFIWLFYIILSYFWVKSFSLYLQFSIIYLMMFFFTWIVIYNNQNISELESTFKTLGFIYVTVIAIGLLEATGIFRLPNSPYARDFSDIYRPETIAFLKSVPTVFFGNPNDLGTFLSLSISFLFPFITFEENKKKKRKLILLLFFSLIVLIFSYSRANILAICIGYMSFLLINNKKRFKNITIIILVITILLTAITIFQDKLPLQLRNMTNIFKILANLNKKTDNSINIRMLIVEQSILAIKEQFWGLGPGNMRHYLGIAAVSNITDPHNWWLELLSEFGIFIFVLYLAFYLNLIFKLFLITRDKYINVKLRKYAMGAFTSLTTMVIAATSPSSILYFVPHWLLIGISISIVSIYGLEKQIFNKFGSE